jgi:hypothetical protein
MRRRDYERFKERLPYIPLDGTWRAWHASKVQRDIEDGKRAAQREIAKDIRTEIVDWKRTIRYQPGKHGSPSFERFMRNDIDRVGREFIFTLMRAWNAGEVADRWSRNKPFYPYFTEFVRDMLYLAFYAMTKPNAALDQNAQADLNLMAHLLHGDVLVSNEQGFLRIAFEELWKPKGRVLMTGTEFLQYMEHF